ncbi:MAG: DUF4124 domain-containing protein [Gammaproteobacteria bacterium]|nr:DUF4124 domain-containing protein [Gammaproteobacteria bacterium]
MKKIIHLDKVNLSTISFSFFLLLSTPTEARLYKWTDENGLVRYGDQLPPEYNNKKYQKLDNQGRVIFTKQQGKDPKLLRKERLAAEKKQKEKEALKRAKQKQLQKQRQQDKVLLLTFNSESEIEYARDQRMYVLDSKVQLLNKSIISTQQKLEGLEQEANEQYLSKNLVVPGGLQQKIEQMEKNKAHLEKKVSIANSKKQDVEKNFQYNLTRFRDLKARQRNIK